MGTFRALAIAAMVTMGFACIDLGALDSTDTGPADGGPSEASASEDAGSGAETGNVPATDADTDTAAPVDAGPPWKLFSRSDSFPNQWETVNLDVAWTGANAPPPRGIIATAQLNKVDRLLVWTAEGDFYLRKAGVWQPPVRTTSVFPALAGLTFRGCYHQPDNPTAGVEELVLVANPLAVQYVYGSTDVITFEGNVTLADEPAPFGAPKGTKQLQWVVRLWNSSGADAASHLAEYSAYLGDPNVYLFDATAMPANKWTFANAPLFKATTNAPPKDDIMSGWRDDQAKITYMIVR